MESNVVHMPVINQQIVENIVKQLKSQGIFDQFRKDCLADVDTKPSYQNLRQRVEGYVSKFLSQQSWNSSMNKNQLRDELRRQINESGMLSIGVEHVVDQIVNSKANRVFLPQIEIAARRYLGLDRGEPINEESDLTKDDKEGDKTKSPEPRESNQSGVKDGCSPLSKEVPCQLNVEEKAQDTTNPIADVSNKDEEAIKEPSKVNEPKTLNLNHYDDYSILNTSRETEISVSGDDELLPPGVDIEPVEEKEIPVFKEQLEVPELSQCDDTNSSFNSEPLVIYDPQESQENSRDATSSNSPKEEEKMEVDNQSSSDTNLPQPVEDLVKEIVQEVKIEPKEETTENSEEMETEINDNKNSGDADDKKNLESEIKKLLELGDKEKLEQEIRRILEIESKKMVEKELKKRESIEAMKNSNPVSVGNEEARTLSTDSMSRSNSSTDLSKDKAASKNEKSKSLESMSTNSDSLSRSNSSSEISKQKHSNKSDKSKSSDSKSKQESTSKSTKESKLQPRDKNKKDHGKCSSTSLSKSNSSKHKSDSKRDNKSIDKSKSATSSNTLSGKSKNSSSSYTLAKPILKSTSSDKDKKSKSGSSSKSDSSSKSFRTETLQISKDKTSSSKTTPSKTIQKSTSKGTSNSTTVAKPKETDRDTPKKEVLSKTKEKEHNEDHIFKSPDINAVEKKPCEFESSETDDDFIRALNSNKKTEDVREDDKKSDLSVSSVHTSDLSSFDDEISLSSSDEMKPVTIPSPVKEVKKIPLKDIKEITATIKDKGSGRSTPIFVEETEDSKKKKLKVKNEPLPSVDESSSSQKEDLTSETQTSDDDKGRTGIRSGLRRQRKINPKYASDEYSSIFNKMRKEKKSVDDTKQTKSQSDATELKKRPYSRMIERKLSEEEISSKSAKIESNRGTRGRNSRS